MKTMTYRAKWIKSNMNLPVNDKTKVTQNRKRIKEAIPTKINSLSKNQIF